MKFNGLEQAQIWGWNVGLRFLVLILKPAAHNGQACDQARLWMSNVRLGQIYTQYVGMGLISGLYMSRRGCCTTSTGPPKTIILIFANPTYNRLQHLILLQLQVNVFYKDCLGCDLVKILYILSSQVGPFVDGPLSKRNTYFLFFFGKRFCWSWSYDQPNHGFDSWF